MTVVIDSYDRVFNRHVISLSSEHGHRICDLVIHGSVPEDERRRIIAEYQRLLDAQEAEELEASDG